MTNQSQNEIPMPPRALKRLSKSLILGGAAIVALGVTVFIIWGTAWVVAAIGGVGGLLMVIGLGLEIASIESHVKQRAGAPAAERSEIDFRLLELAQELRRPFFQRRAIFVVVCITPAPFIVAWTFKTLWPLLGLIFPAALVITVWLATLDRKYEAIKRAFISQLPAAERNAFLDLIYKSDDHSSRSLNN